MKQFGAVVHRIPGGQALLDLLFMVMGPSVGDDHEAAGEKGVDDGEQKDEGRHQIERLLPDAVAQDADDAAQILVAIAFQAGRKDRRIGRRPAGCHDDS